MKRPQLPLIDARLVYPHGVCPRGSAGLSFEGSSMEIIPHGGYPHGINSPASLFPWCILFG